MTGILLSDAALIVPYAVNIPDRKFHVDGFFPFGYTGDESEGRFSGLDKLHVPARFRADLARERNALGKKIAEARKARKMTQAELSEALKAYGVSVQTPAVNKWESGETVPGAYQLLALCHALDIRQGLAFFTGKVSAPADPLNAEGRRMLRQYRSFLESQERYLTPLREPAMIRVRLSTLPASAGTGDFLAEGGFEWVDFPESVVPRGTDFAVRVHGNSMEPAYQDGQIVFFERCERLENGDVGLFAYEGQGYIKLYAETLPEGAEAEETLDSYGVVHPKVSLVSLNPQYAPLAVTSPLTVFGRALN